MLACQRRVERERETRRVCAMEYIAAHAWRCANGTDIAYVVVIASVSETLRVLWDGQRGDIGYEFVPRWIWFPEPMQILIRLLFVNPKKFCAIQIHER